MEEIEFAPPDKSKFNTIQSLLSDFEDQTFIFYANPKNCAEFDNVMNCIEEWLNYTLLWESLKTPLQKQKKVVK